MSGLTTDPFDPDLTRGSDEKPVPQSKKYLILSNEERAKGFIRPFRDKYIHVGPPEDRGEMQGSVIVKESKLGCGKMTRMGQELAETYARDPKFYGSTYCVHCQKHRPVNEFFWAGTTDEVGS